MNAKASRKAVAAMTPAARKFFVDYWQRSPSDAQPLIDWAIQQITEGRDSPSLRILAGLTAFNNDEADACFHKALAELEEYLPEKSECFIYYCGDVARAVAQLQLPPFDGFAILWQIADALDYPDALQRWGSLEMELDLMTDIDESNQEREAVIYRECERFTGLLEGYTETGAARFTLEKSLERLRKEDWDVPVSLDEIPRRMPKPDDEIRGLNFFRIQMEQADFRDLTIPRTLFLRSEITHSRFDNTDLTESAMTWCDWNGCDFTRADLRGCDLRHSIFRNCHFSYAQLDGADLQGAQFIDCSFREASMKKAKLKKTLGLFAAMCSKELKLSDQQVNEIEWVTNAGAEPAGG